jgi:hypothetical protein
LILEEEKRTAENFEVFEEIKFGKTRYWVFYSRKYSNTVITY